MPETPVPDFTKDEIRVIQDTLKERYGHEVEVELAEAEMTLCPIVYWEVGDCHFVVAKVDKYHFMNHFYYRLYQTYATEKRRFDDVLDCVVSLLRAQADYELKEQGVTGKK